MCREIWSVIPKRYFTPELNIFHSARNSEFGIWDFAMASSYNGEIWDLQVKLGLFWDQNLGLKSLTESKLSLLDNVVQKQALSESIQIGTFPLGKETHNDKHN